MKKLGILPTKVAHRGWRNKEAVDRLTDLGLIEKFKIFVISMYNDDRSSLFWVVTPIVVCDQIIKNHSF